MSRELKELRKELAEMKNLLRMSFDMQMDLQRAVRQEVAAAMATSELGTAVDINPVLSPMLQERRRICQRNPRRPWLTATA